MSGGGIRVGGKALLAAVFFWTTGAWAQEPVAATPATPVPAPGEVAAPADPGAHELPTVPEENEPVDAGPGLKWSGRLFARATADERTDFDRDFSVPDARIDLQASLSHVTAKIEADLASKSILKDAYVTLHDTKKKFRLQGGQFKAPFFSRELESTWELPIVGRGLVDDFLVEKNSLGGRRLGLMAEAKLKKALGLRASVGVFQGAYDLDLQKHTSEDVAARVSFRPFTFLQVGSSAYLAEAFRGTKRFGTGLDATVFLGRLRVTGEGLLGKIALGPFQGGLALASYDVPLDPSGEWVLQPVAQVELLSLSGEQKGQGWGAGGGLNLVWADRVKLMLQGERALKPGDPAPANDVALQLGVRF